MSSVIKPVCDRCGVVNERKWNRETSERTSLIYCKGCSNTFEIEVVDYPVDAPKVDITAKVQEAAKESREAYYAELNRPFIPGIS